MLQVGRYEALLRLSSSRRSQSALIKNANFLGSGSLDASSAILCQSGSGNLLRYELGFSLITAVRPRVPLSFVTCLGTRSCPQRDGQPEQIPPHSLEPSRPVRGWPTADGRPQGELRRGPPRRGACCIVW